MASLERTLSLTKVLAAKNPSLPMRSLLGLADRCLGLTRLDSLYRQHDMAGLPPADFAWRTLDVLEVDLQESRSLAAQVPTSGAVLVVANHPLGGIEGVALAALLAKHRPDVKILANRALSMFPELRSLFIFTNPFRSNSAGNVESLRQCHRHLALGGVLVVFPAGRVSYFNKNHDGITDYPWHRMLGHLIDRHRLSVLPVFIGGKNSNWFYRFGRVHSRLRLLLLTRELVKHSRRSLPVYPGRLIENRLPACSAQEIVRLMRLLCYLQNPEFRQAWPPISKRKLKPLAVPAKKNALQSEIDTLPNNQRLLAQNELAVYYGYSWQIPVVVSEIRRLREYTYRLMDEGSGEPEDGDGFDSHYTHLFIYHPQSQKIVGAYRMGQTDQILAHGGSDRLYLNQVFSFSDNFFAGCNPLLEMGRSFIVPQWQRRYHSLLLLFKGIGAFVCLHPQYRTLYGTVSLSRQYDPLSICLMEQFLVEPGQAVKAKRAFQYPISPELADYLTNSVAPGQRKQRLAVLDWLVKQIEKDGKGLPALLKQYYQLGARFHGLAIDPGFSHTPGLLLSVHIPSAPDNLIRRYLGDKAGTYLQGH